jgi:hypothetical protein
MLTSKKIAFKSDTHKIAPNKKSEHMQKPLSKSVIHNKIAPNKKQRPMKKSLPHQTYTKIAFKQKVKHHHRNFLQTKSQTTSQIPFKQKTQKPCFFLLTQTTHCLYSKNQPLSDPSPRGPQRRQKLDER